MNAEMVKKPSIMVVMMVATVLLGTAGLTMTTTTTQHAFAYENNQAQSFVNECGLDGSTGPNCANNGPQTIGDGVANALTPLQISNSGQRGTEEPQPETCEKCIRNVLTDEEQTELMELFNRLPLPGGPGGGAGKPVEIIEELCDRILQSPSPFDTIQSIEELLGPGTESIPGMNLEQDRIDEIINCLKAVFNV